MRSSTGQRACRCSSTSWWRTYSEVISGIADLEHRLPESLVAYFDDLLKRLSIGALQALLTPLIVTIAWAREPLDEDTLLLLMSRRKVLRAGEADRPLLHRGLIALGSMLRLALCQEVERVMSPITTLFASISVMIRIG